MRRYWMSWWAYPRDTTPKWESQHLLGYWVTVWTSLANDVSVCALVQADSPGRAHSLVRGWWPTITERDWRFSDERPADWVPSDTDRFPLSPDVLPKVSEVS